MQRSSAAVVRAAMSAQLTPMMTMDHLKEIGLLGGVTVPVAPPSVQAPAAQPAAEAAAPAKAAKAKQQAAKPSAPAPAPAASASSSSAAAAAPAAPVPEKTAQELAKMSKDERTAYHKARREAQIAAKAEGGEQKESEAGKITKAQRRAIQDAQRKAKEDKNANSGEFEELLKDLKLQGLSEERAREVIAEMAKNDVVDSDDDDDDGEAEDLEASVKRWMNEQEQVTNDALSDFNLKVRFQGHVDTTPPDHLRSILLILFEQACEGLDFAAPKIQPTAVAKKVEPAVVRWAKLLEPLYGKISDVLQAADVVVQTTLEAMARRPGVPEAGQACGVVGCLMAIREIDMIEDEDLLTGCRRVENPSRVMQGFMKHIEEELDDDDDDEDDED